MKNTYQVIILGPGGVGKTRGACSFIKIMSDLYGLKTSVVMPWSETMVVTSNFVLHNVTYPRGFFEGINEPMNVSLYDMGGQFKYQTMWEQLAQDTDAIICVVDTSRRNTLKQIPLMLPRGIMEGVPIRLVVNKADLYIEFAQKADLIGKAIHKILMDTALFGIVSYNIIYRGTQQFIYENKIYKYGDNIPIFRKLVKDDEGDYSLKLTDFEILISPAFQQILPELTDHNANLFGRELMLQMFEILFNQNHTKEIKALPESLIIAAHQEAPPFISWGEDPPGFIPGFNRISEEMCIHAVNKMLIEDDDIINMIVLLSEKGYKLHTNPVDSFEFTSAQLTQEDSKLSYSPINKAFLPSKFIRDFIDFSEAKNAAEEEEFFI